MNERNKQQIYCSECNRNTNHIVHCERRVTSSDESSTFWTDTHYFAQCAGCDSFRYAICTLTDDHFADGDVEGIWKTYPRSEDERRPMHNSHELPNTVRIICEEVINAINSQLSVLAAIGLRTLIESVCKERNVAGNTLETLIDGLAEKGVLSNSQAQILHGHRFIGNMAAHEIRRADHVELLSALEIAESMLTTIYILPLLSKRISPDKQ